VKTTARSCLVLLSVVAFCVLLLGGDNAAKADTSDLWGAAGEKWTPESRLPDFSFAGYRRGEEPFHIPKAQISVAAFGAKGDGKTDSTAAFKNALAVAQGQVLVIPPGRYVLSDLLEIKRSNIVLRGAGPEKTTLLFVNPLEKLRPTTAKTDSGQPTTQWSWSGGLIAIGDCGNVAKGAAARVTADARRGARKLVLDRRTFHPGDEIILTVNDDEDQSLLKYLYRGQTGDISGLNKWKVRQVFRITEVAGQEVSLDRGLRFEVRAAWQPTVAKFAPAVTDVGVEGVAFEFPATPYAGHFKELGFNPVAINASAAHCWLRNIRVHNGDSGPYVNGFFCTIDGIRLTADPERRSKQGHTGHHGIQFGGSDCLCTNFQFDTLFIHDLTVQSALGCVFSKGKALDLNMDHHRWAPYENLFADIDAGEGRRLFSSSGGGNRGAHTAAGETFWNIRSRQTVAWPKSLGIDAINVVAAGVRGPAEHSPTGRWLDPINPAQLQPPDLHAAMQQKRLGGKATGKSKERK